MIYQPILQHIIWLNFMNIIYSPIGCIHSPFTSLEGMPIQPRGAAQVEGRIEIYPPFRQDRVNMADVIARLKRQREARCHLKGATHVRTVVDIDPSAPATPAGALTNRYY